MLAEVATAFVDAKAGSLRLALDLPPQPALRDVRLRVGGCTIELRVLGASHQAIAAVDGARLSETVACLPAGGGPLPEALERREGPLRYAFTSTVEQLGPDALRERAQALRAQVSGDDLALAGLFPGSPDALTALWCRPVDGGVSWETVHLYPHTGELVGTSSLVVAA